MTVPADSKLDEPPSVAAAPPAPVAAVETWADLLRRGAAVGYAVCVKARRYERLPEAIGQTFAELGEEGWYFVYEDEAEARRRLAAWPAEAQLGWLVSVREVVFLPEVGAGDGPRLDVRGHPLALRAILVDRAGTLTPWPHGGQFGWHTPPPTPVVLAPAAPAAPGWLEQWWARLWRRR